MKAFDTMKHRTGVATVGFFFGWIGLVHAAAVHPRVLLEQHACTACHAQDQAMLGPSFHAMAKKYPDQATYLASKIKSGSSGVWGSLAMPAQTAPDEDIRAIAVWLANGMK